MKNKSLTEFLSEEYKEFAIYSIENRAIASIIDGFKPTQRKIIHISNKTWKNGSEKTLKVFQLAGKVASDAFYHHGDCLSEDTEIILADGTNISIGEWFNKFPGKDMEVLCYDEDKKEFTKGIGHSPRIGHITNEEYEIEMVDGNIVRCTSNHPFLTDRGWVEAKDLKEDDNIINLTSSP